MKTQILQFISLKIGPYREQIYTGKDIQNTSSYLSSYVITTFQLYSWCFLGNFYKYIT